MPKKSKKKKRNRSKKHKFTPNKNSRVEKLEQKSSTNQSVEPTEAVKEVKEQNEVSAIGRSQKSVVKNTAVEELVSQTSEVKDAKFSILLFLVLVAIFIGLYVLMLNTNVSEFLYGLINIENITR